MQSSTAQAAIQRLENGENCENHGCYDSGVWLVIFREEKHHWCSKHTRSQMRKATAWRYSESVSA